MLTGRRVKVYLMSPTVEDGHIIQQTRVKTFPGQVAEEGMTNLRTLEHLDVLTVYLQLHTVLFI